MSFDASVMLNWGDGKYNFRLRIGELQKLQEITGAGPLALMDRISARQWRVEDLRETLRFGLIGGGMSVAEAELKIRMFVDGVPLLESANPAYVVLGAAVLGAKNKQDDDATEDSDDGSEGDKKKAKPSASRASTKAES